MKLDMLFLIWSQYIFYMTTLGTPNLFLVNLKSGGKSDDNEYVVDIKDEDDIRNTHEHGEDYNEHLPDVSKYFCQ